MRFIVALLALLASDAAMAQHQTFRDANGRTLGSSVTDSRGNTTYYDSMGRNTGRSVTNSNGNTTFYDEMGRTTGRSTTDSNGTTILYDSLGRRTGTIQGASDGLSVILRPAPSPRRSATPRSFGLWRDHVAEQEDQRGSPAETFAIEDGVSDTLEAVVELIASPCFRGNTGPSNPPRSIPPPSDPHRSCSSPGSQRYAGTVLGYLARTCAGGENPNAWYPATTAALGGFLPSSR